MPSLWNKYQKIKEINSKLNIKTYSAKLELIIKEIIPKDEDNNNMILDYFHQIKDELNIYDIIEENKKLYIIIENNDQLAKKIDDLLLSGELGIEKESIIEGHGKPITKEEIFDLFKMEESICKIKFQRIENNKLKEGKGSGFFCEIKTDEFPLKYCLFINNHILNETNIKTNNTIYFECLKDSKYVEQKIKINEDRKVYTNYMYRNIAIR
jgi:hypothetical protein